MEEERERERGVVNRDWGGKISECDGVGEGERERERETYLPISFMCETRMKEVGH